jgi:hypothetical protein
VTEPNMGDLHDHSHAAQQDDLLAPVELEGFPRREAQRNVGARCELSVGCPSGSYRGN